MATTLDTLVVRTRRFMRAYPAQIDALSASLTTTVTTVTIADTSQTAANQYIEVDYETMLVKSVSNATTLTVARGVVGSTAATHASAATVLIRPAFYATEIIDALNEAKDAAFPYVFLPVKDTSLSADSTTYEFTVPNMPGTYGGDSIPIPIISRIELLVTGDVSYKRVDSWRVERSATPKIRFRRAPFTGTLRIHGMGPFPDFAAASDTVNAAFPKNAERLLPLGAAVALLGSGEAGRTRFDTGTRDDREAANKPGAAIALANQLERRYEKELARVAQPPLSKSVEAVL